jgi:hypothetical protein
LSARAFSREGLRFRVLRPAPAVVVGERTGVFGSESPVSGRQFGTPHALLVQKLPSLARIGSIPPPPLDGVSELKL